MQAIVTKYLGPTDHRGSRIKARTEGGDSLTVDYRHDLPTGEPVHRVAAEALRDKLGWAGDLAGGSIPGGYAFVFVSGRSRHS